MKKLSALLLSASISVFVFGQNPKRITTIPGSSGQISWPCNGLQLYENYVAATNNMQLWRTDGTVAGTFPITNFPNGSGQLRLTAEHAVVVGNVFYFRFLRIGALTYELWKTDGTENGTIQVDVSSIGNTTGDLMANSTHLFITSLAPYEDLYSIDNTGQITYLARLKTGFYYNSLAEGRAAIFKNKLVVAQSEFNLQGNPTGLNNLFITDGTIAGSYTQASLLPVVPRKMTPCGDNFLLIQLYNFPNPHNSLAKLPGLPNNGIGNIEVFYTPSSSNDIKDYKYHTNSSGSGFNGISTFQGNATLGNSIMLSGYSDNHGWELWKTDGTAAGTVLVKDIYPGIGSAFEPWNGFVINGKFIFDAYTNTPGRRIFYSDGTTIGTDFFPQRPVSNNPNMSLVSVCYSNGKAYFSSIQGTPVNFYSSIWETDGNIINTLPLTPPLLSPDGGFVPFGFAGNDNLIFRTRNETGLTHFIASLNPNYKLWNGSADNDWNNPSNWTENNLPSSADNVLIPASAPDYPVINQNTFINNLWINGGTVTSNNNLNINGEISITANTSLNGTGNLSFTGTANHIYDGTGTINVPVNLNGGDVNVAGGSKNLPHLNFLAASKFFLGNNDVTVTANNITTPGNDRYIVTDGTGTLLQTVSNATVTFPIGTASSYSPVSITNNGSQIFSTRLSDSAFENYNTVIPESSVGPASTNNSVNKTWYINIVGGGSVINPTAQFQWNSSDELPGFNRTYMKAGHYSTSGWTYSTNGSSAGNNPYNFTFTNVPSFSPFILLSDQQLTRFYSDSDNDGYGNIGNYIDAYTQPQGYITDSSDCNDNNASANPAATEIQNSIDDNCDGQVDEGLIGFNQFIFLKGNTTDYRYASYGTQGVASVSNNPGKRMLAATWETNDKIYIFGGEGNATQLSSPGGNPPPPAGYLNDLWEYDINTNNWRWLKGSSALGAGPTHGTQGVPAANNTPGARKNGASWLLNGKLYLFGGYVTYTTQGRVNDLWEYDPATGNWRWLNGTPTSSNIAPVYGTQGIYDAANNPGGREDVVTWVYNNKLYLFGGLRGITGIGDVSMSDVWEYDPAINQWRWLSGPSAYNNSSVVGTPGVGDADNYPGGRFQTDAKIINDKLYMFGGWGYTTGFYHRDDLWEFDHVTGFWRLLKGDVENAPRVTGTQGVYSTTNTPGARHGHKLSIQNNTLYLYGGNTFNAPSGILNDLWQYDPSLNQWRYVKGTTSVNSLGTYGQRQVESNISYPAGRKLHSLTSAGNNLFLFGGRGYSGVTSAADEYQNDLWRFNTTNNNWTWLNGPSGKERYGEYNTVENAANKPGDRVGHAMASANGKVYLFGGNAKRTYNHEGGSNDLWEYNPATNNWKFLKGSSTSVVPENYGTQGVSSGTNMPSVRFWQVMWSLNNKVYMFGGQEGGYKNDLWEFDPSTNNWTWLKGSTGSDVSGVFGVKGVASPANTPGARIQAGASVYNNKLYLFGGEGYNSGTTRGLLNDLWEYDPAANNWTWIGGDDAINSFGVYGTIGVADEANKPGARADANLEALNGSLYMFGNLGYGPSGSIATLRNDLWKFDLNTGQWTFVKGSNTGTATPSTGSLGVEAATNMPGARTGASSYVIGNRLYIFGGTPFSNSYNDLWEYNPVTNNWRWIKGPGNSSNQRGNYGLTGIAASTSYPPARKNMETAVIGNTAYLFGGNGQYATNIGDNFNDCADLWKWNGENPINAATTKLYVNDNNMSGDIYTSAIGNDNNPGTPAAPLATLDYAVLMADAGDTIYVDAGTYITPNFTIGKAITILGTNYITSPNNPTDKLLANPARNDESIITGSTITIGSSNISIEGLAFDPGNKSAFILSNTSITNNDFGNFNFQKNILKINSSVAQINLVGKFVTSPAMPVTFNYSFTDNRFEKFDAGLGTTIQLSYLKNISINNNSFVVAGATPRTQLPAYLGFTGLVDNVTFSNNTVDKGWYNLFSARIVNATISDNKFYNSQLGMSLNNSVNESSNIEIVNNLIECSTVGSGQINYSRSNGSLAASSSILKIENNTINITAIGNTSQNLEGMNLLFNNSVLNPSLIIRGNSITHSGDIALVANGPRGIALRGKLSDVLVENNELLFNASNVIPQTVSSTTSLVFPGIVIYTDVSAGAFIPSDAVITIQNNKILGYRQSIAFYDISAAAPNTYVGYGNLPSGAAVSINNNSFTGDEISINNGTNSQTVNANCNWYGATSSQSVLAKITPSTVYYTPWLTDGTDTDIPTVGFQPAAGSCDGTSPVITLESYTNITCYGANNGTINVTVTGGFTPYNYDWTKEGDPGFSSGQEDLSNLAPGTYYLVVRDENDSYSGQLTVTLTEPPAPLTINLTGANITCFGNNNGSITANVTGGTAPYTYLWSNGATTQSISGLAPGGYTVVVNDVNGCNVSTGYNVTEPAGLSVIMTGTAASCNGSATATPAGGTVPYSYLWSNGATTSIISNVPAGVYTVTVTDVKGCTVNGSYTITGNSPINPTTSLVPVSCFGGSDGNITVTGANAGTAPYTYNLNGSAFQASNVFNNLTVGVYIVGIRDANGCSDFVTRTITQPAALTAVLDSTRTACFGANTGRIYITANGGNTGKTYSWTGPNGYISAVQDPNGIVAGTYNVTVTDSKGCTTGLQVILPEWPVINISETVTHVACRGDFTGAIDVTVSGGTGNGFAISWTGPNGFTATTVDIIGLKAGNYKIKVTDNGSGCSVQKTITVMQPAAVLNLTTAKTNVTGCNILGTITANVSGGTAPYQYTIDGINYQSSGIFTGLAAGSYSVNVLDAQGCSVAKGVSITDNGSDEYEGNNSRNNAAIMNLNTTINARIAPTAGDIDWFRFTTNAADASYIVSVNHLSVNYTFDLYNSSGTIVAPVSSVPGSKFYTLGVNTTYFVRITGALSLVCYNLNISTPVMTRMSTNTVKDQEKYILPATVFDVSVLGNPSHTGFFLQVKSGSDEKVLIKMMDAAGRVMEIKNNLTANTPIKIGDSYIQGIYFAEIIQGKNKRVVKLIKMQ